MIAGSINGTVDVTGHKIKVRLRSMTVYFLSTTLGYISTGAE